MNTEVIILAGGKSSRFGRYKQIEPVSSKNETIIELLIINSINVGITKIRIVIPDELEKHFELLKIKYKDVCSITVIIQILPHSMLNEKNLSLGVGYALWLGCKDIDNDFIVMNGDDYYNQEAIKCLKDKLVKSTKDNEYFMIGYSLQNTLLDYSNRINRGICDIDRDNNITEIKIVSSIQKDVAISGLINGKKVRLNGKEHTCMNLYGFKKHFKNYLNNYICNELKHSVALKSELTIHLLINKLIAEKHIKVISVPTETFCFGLTTPEDLYKLREKLKI